MKRSHHILILINLAVLASFGWVFVARANYEFVFYVGVVGFFLIVVATTLRRFEYTTATLVGLTVWSAMHMAGGGIAVGTGEDGGPGRLYDVILWPLSDTLPILRYDQLVHVWGFGASTLVMFCLLRGSLRRPGDPEGRRLTPHPYALGLVLVMAGLGVGAFNEIVEFVVAGIVGSNGVGGYLNTSLDLVADLIGALLGVAYIRFRYWAPRNRLTNTPTP